MLVCRTPELKKQNQSIRVNTNALPELKIGSILKILFCLTVFMSVWQSPKLLLLSHKNIKYEQDNYFNRITRPRW